MRLLPRTAFMLLAAYGANLQGQASAPVRICLAPSTAEGANSTTAAAAVRASFAAFLTGPSLSSQALQAPLLSQAREEAKQAGCPFILVTTLKLVTKSSGGGMLGRVAAGVARQGVAEAGIPTSTAAGRIVGSAASGAVQQATQDFAGSVRNRDEVTLGWRLEAADGTVLVDKKEKRAAKADGEDLITPLVQVASEQVVEAAKRKAP
jgi:hypothetical protein